MRVSIVLKGMLSATAMMTTMGPLATHAGVIFTYEVTSRGVDFRTVISVQGNNVRLDSHDGQEETVVILNGDRQKIYLLDPRRRGYTELDERQVALLKQLARDIPRRQQEEGRPLAASEADALRDVMEQTGDPAIGPPATEQSRPKFEIIGGPTKVDRFSCLPYRQTINDRPEEEGCVVPWKQAELDPAELEYLDRLESLFAGLAETDPQQRGIKQLSRYPGLPAHLVTLDPDGSHASEERLTSVTRSAISVEAFVVPEGYQRGRMREMD